MKNNSRNLHPWLVREIKLMISLAIDNRRNKLAMTNEPMRHYCDGKFNSYILIANHLARAGAYFPENLACKQFFNPYTVTNI